ncbi:MAG TPA: hypothetical protein VI454_08050 [Verrucomicrobiae bacterium]|jgi:hypothetical protein
MKNLMLVPSLVCALIAAIFVATSPAARAAVQQGEAVAVAVKGTADYTVNGRDWLPLRANDTLKPGAEIRTADGASVDLFLNYNGPVVAVQPGSHLVLSKLDREEKGDQVVTDTLLEVKKGAIMGYAQKIATGSRYVIKTPESVVTVTGTLYYVYATGYVYVQTGAVEVKYSPRGASRFSTSAVNVPEGFYLAPGASTPTLTPPPVGDTIVATISTSIGNVRRFNLSRGRKLEIKAVAPASL